MQIDIELALDAAHRAAPSWGKTSVTYRSNLLNKVADRIEQNLELLAVVETIDNGRQVRRCSGQLCNEDGNDDFELMMVKMIVDGDDDC